MNKILKETSLDFVYQYHNKNILERQSFDFYISSKNIAIECQGEQHFIANFFRSKGIEYSEEHLKYVQKLDKRKKEICKRNGIKLINYLDKKFVQYLNKSQDIYATNKEELIKLINYF